jgi:hypothetical protein
MSTTLQQLEQKLNVKQMVRDNPWPALALAVGAGVLLSGSRSDVKAAAATAAATRGATSKVGGVLDDVVAGLVGGIHDAIGSQVAVLVKELTSALGARVAPGSGANGAAPPQSATSGPSSPIQEASIDRHESDTRSGDAAAPMQDSRAD